ncbi:MAG: response regulator [Anaerolineae bacterium]|nr:response regulator [Anaerolineae bacterium]MBN8620959.1 response regulator [Anaerolineae bacterium]
MSRIVVIEDNPDSSRLAEKLLKHAGHQVTAADSGESGLLEVLAVQPDLVLMDLGLPDIDGQTVVAMIRQNPDVQHIKVLAFTAWPEERAAAMAQAYGCDGVINKPIDTRQFAGQVAAYLGAQEETPEA